MNWRACAVLSLIVVINSICICKVKGSSAGDFLRLTLSHKIALDKFKERVLTKISFPHEYMKQDVNLIRWLRAADYNVNKAERMLQNNLHWRQTNRMDTIMEEDWTEFQEKFPYYLGNHARNGEPIFMAHIGEWDLRAAAVAGKMPKLIRYQTRVAEEALALLNKEMATGKNVTQVQFFVNMDGYSVIQQGCPQCMTFYIGLITQYEDYYPNFVDNIILINTPPVFEVVLRVIRPLMHPMTRKSLKVYGMNKSVWEKDILQLVDRSQLLPEFGGTYRPRS